MRSTYWPLSSLFAAVALLVIGVGLLFSVIGLRAGQAQFPDLVTGLVMSAYFAGFIAGTWLCPKLIGRFGHIRAFATLGSVASVAPILHAFWVNPWFWGGLRFLTGLCLVGLYVVVESWLNAVAPTQSRGRIFSAYMAVSFLALALGQWLILVGTAADFIPFALVSIIFSLAVLPITLTPLAPPPPVQAPQLNLRQLYQDSPMGTAGAFASGLLSGAFFGLGAVFAQRAGLGAAEVATFMAATILGGALFQWPVGHLSDRLDRRLVLLWICGGSAFVAILAFLSSQWWPSALIALGVLYGGLVFTIYGISVAHVNDIVGPSRALEASGGLLLLHGVGAAAGPTIAGALMGVLGGAVLMLYFALVLAGLAAFTRHRMQAAANVSDEQKSEFVVMAGAAGGSSSQVVLQMDPRVPDDAMASAAAHRSPLDGMPESPSAGEQEPLPSQAELYPDPKPDTSADTQPERVDHAPASPTLPELSSESGAAMPPDNAPRSGQ